MARPATGSMKGQILVFEQVMLFAIGVMIFAICFFSFSSYQSYYSDVGNADQLDQVRDQIAYGIVRMSEGWSSTASYLKINIPSMIGGELYRVSLSPRGLNLSLMSSFKSSFSTLYGLNLTSQMVTSEATSSAGVVVLYKNGNKIIVT